MALTFHQNVVYLSVHSHHSVQKALHIAGMTDVVLRYVEVDPLGRIEPNKLESVIQNDRTAGLSPWLLVASGGTTNLGSVDPLKDLGDIAKRHGLWYHVDAAYGGFFLLTAEGKEVLSGMELADSVVLDPHKSLFVPFGTGAVLVKEGIGLYRAHAHTADYMQDADTGEDWRNPSDLSVELTRPFRAMRMWLPLKVLGVAPFRAALEEKLLLAQHAYQRMKDLPRFEMGPEPQLSIFVFRYVPEHGDPNAFNKRLVEAIREDGEVFLSSTVVEQKFMLRFPILSFRSHLTQVNRAIDVIERCAEKLHVLA
ncbi:MAG: aminotransferase class V-fold PLP-dependent enzyme [Pseudomonadota bacterium]